MQVSKVENPLESETLWSQESQIQNIKLVIFYQLLWYSGAA